MMSTADWKLKAQKVAAGSDFYRPNRRTGCLIVRRNDIIARGHNKMKNRVGVNRQTVHAEIDALNATLQADGTLRAVKGSTVYVFRVNGGVSRPCEECTLELLEAQVKAIVFENEKHETVIWRVN